MSGALFDPEEVEAERSVILAELEGGENDPAQLLTEEVSATACAVSHVVADQVGHYRRVARVVFGDARFNLAHEVCAHVSSLGVNPSAKLGEQRNEARPEAKAHDE